MGGFYPDSATYQVPRLWISHMTYAGVSPSKETGGNKTGCVYLDMYLIDSKTLMLVLYWRYQKASASCFHTIIAPCHLARVHSINYRKHLDLRTVKTWETMMSVLQSPNKSSSLCNVPMGPGKIGIDLVWSMPKTVEILVQGLKGEVFF